MDDVADFGAHMMSEGGGASRSTDPAAGTSSATDISLREYVVSLINAVERRSDERFDSMKEMVEKAFESSQEAIRKAESATEKRFESVNEFRAVLTDQQQHLVSRQVLDSVSDKLTAAIDRNRDDLDQLTKRLDLREGQDSGTRLTTGMFLTIGGLIIAALGLLFIAANYLAR